MRLGGYLLLLSDLVSMTPIMNECWKVLICMNLFVEGGGVLQFYVFGCLWLRSLII